MIAELIVKHILNDRPDHAGLKFTDFPLFQVKIEVEK